MRLGMNRHALAIVFVGSLVTSVARADDGDVHEGSSPATRADGPALAIVGGVTTATGTLFLGLGATSDVNLEIAGAITAGFGLAASIAGAVLAVVNSKTMVTSTVSDAPPRSPTWHDASAGPAEVARPTLLPLFSRSF